MTLQDVIQYDMIQYIMIYNTTQQDNATEHNNPA